MFGSQEVLVLANTETEMKEVMKSRTAAEKRKGMYSRYFSNSLINL